MKNPVKIKAFMELYLNRGKIFRRVVDIGEWIIIFTTAIFFPRPHLNFFPFNCIIGFAIFLGGFIFHYLAHKVNPYSHYPKEEVKKIVTAGIYSKIRHPIYSGYILMYLGIFFILRSFSTLVPITIFSLLFLHSVFKEERFLEKKFGSEYHSYKKKVPWRFIPYIF